MKSEPNPLLVSPHTPRFRVELDLKFYEDFTLAVDNNHTALDRMLVLTERILRRKHRDTVRMVNEIARVARGELAGAFMKTDRLTWWPGSPGSLNGWWLVLDHYRLKLKDVKGIELDWPEGDKA